MTGNLEKARKIYKKIMEIIQEAEKEGFCCHWDECISINEEFFSHSQLYEG